MTTKRYRLKKDLPNLKAGAEFRHDQFDNCYTHHKIFDNGTNKLFRYTAEDVENNTDWFEEIQEKEFTKSDMIEFATFSAGCPRDTNVEEDLKHWLEIRQNQ